jgi:outer membrane lipoprotein-sorting protein
VHIGRHAETDEEMLSIAAWSMRGRMSNVATRNHAKWLWGTPILIIGIGCGEGSNANGSSGSVSASPSSPLAPHSSSSTSSLPTSSEPAPPLSGSAPSTASTLPSSSPVASSSPTSSPTSAKSATPDAGAPVQTSHPVASNDVPDAGGSTLPTPVPGSADAVAADIDALYLPKKTFKAKFKQKYKQKITGNEKDSSGVVFVEKPGKISFHYDPPNKNRIVSDGKTVKVYVADDAQMFEKPMKGTEYPGALSFIMGEGIRTSFTFTINEKATFDKGPVLVGKPRSETPDYEAALFYVDKDKLAKKDLGAMSGVLILDAQGNRNRFDFSDAEMPDKIDPAEFTFTPPSGTSTQ